MRLTAVVVLIMLLGCAHSSYPTSVDGLKTQGYQPSGSRFTPNAVPLNGSKSTSDAAAPVAYYQVWSKETRDDGRRVHLCIEPGWSGGSYIWRAIVNVDGRETWNYSTGPANTGGTEQVISCATTDPLSEGMVTWRTGYKYRQ
jgi:hypothetical protein